MKPDDSSPTREENDLGPSARRVALAYLAIGVAWILTSDLLVSQFSLDKIWSRDLSIIKGAAFVFATALLLYFLVKKALARQHRALAARQADRDLLKSLIESYEGPIFAKDLSGRYILANRAASNALDLTADQILGRTVDDLFAPDYAREVRQIDDRIIRSGTAERYEQLMTEKGAQKVLLVDRNPIINREGRVLGVVSISHDITQRRQAEEALRRSLEVEKILYRELDHRVRNNLTALLALVDIARRESNEVKSFAESVSGRIGAMANVHAMLGRSRWQSLDLRALIEEIAPRSSLYQISLEGPAVLIPSAQANAFGMVMHELFTNSAKHGALSSSNGRINARWTQEPGANSETNVTLTWSEQDGPAVPDQIKCGTGTSLIQGLLKSELQGSATLTYHPAGVHHMLRITLSSERDDQLSGFIEDKPLTHQESS